MKLSGIILMLVVCLPFTAQAEKIIFSTGNLPPYEYREGGQVVGMNIDIIRELCKRIGVEPEFVEMPWKRTLKEAERGTISAIFALHFKEERQKFLYYTSEPIFIVKLACFVQKKKDIRVTSPEDLRGKSIGVISDYSYGPEFDRYKGLKKVYCGDSEELARILDGGRIDAALDFEIPFRFFARQQGSQDKIRKAFVLTEAPLYIGVSKALGQRGHILAEDFSRELARLKKEGLIQRILDRYR
ncbi:amino acid ABC transporter substrate-binding pro tein [Desulfonema ishimotonii]|uniref:Amino acid ABC transporter substrate-binding pro tein n=1 Tax=Desulfonema ishimotonii TaxID=45657 RepID=A0A401FW26_9BACT|nr:transporter substrate-binding domain-containing protein [Desulfonema ishimotonii]GBC61170.1 amino acid ABC transporter substrate-binding pro tein [Desulfonema ishimotonii]